MAHPSQSGPLPAHKLCFTDDRIFIDGTLDGLAATDDHCIRKSTLAGRVPNLEKLERYMIEICEARPVLIKKPVLGTMPSTCKTTLWVFQFSITCQ